jgi:hypothetical protein
VVQRNTVSGVVLDTIYPQTQWNLDKLDGTGASGLTVNPLFNQIHIIDLQWLGAGKVRFGFDFGSKLVYCHQIINNNQLTAPYMQSACLPVRYEILNVGTPAVGNTLKQICSTVISESGARDNPQYQFTAGNGATLRSVTTALPIITIKPATAFGGFQNRILNTLKRITINTITVPIFYQLIYNGTLSGGSFGSVDTNSGMTYDVAATGISGGTVVDSGYITVANGLDRYLTPNKLPITLNMAGNAADTLSVVVTSTGSSTSVGATLSWEEQH